MKQTNRTPSKQESNIEREIRLALPENVRTFRNNVGTGWTGDTSRTKSGDLIIANARPLKAGLCKGSSDEIGWMTVEITPEMVGKKIAVFVALEIKTLNGKPSKEQNNFIANVIRAGGVSGIVRSPEQAVELLNGWVHGVE